MIAAYTSTGSTHFYISVEGYFTEALNGGAGDFFPIGPTRVADSSAGTPGTNGKLLPGTGIDISLLGSGLIPNGATAAFVNVTVQDPASTGTLKVGPGGENAWSLPTLFTYQPGRTTGSTLAVPLSPSGTIRLNNPSGGSPIHYAVDVQGYFWNGEDGDPGGTFTPLSATGVYNTGGSYADLEPWERRIIQLGGRGGLPDDGTLGAVALNITVAQWGNKTGSLSVIAAEGEDPVPRNIYFNGGDPRSESGISSLALISTPPLGDITIRNASSATVRIRIHTQGWFLFDESSEESPLEELDEEQPDEEELAPIDLADADLAESIWTVGDAPTPGTPIIPGTSASAGWQTGSSELSKYSAPTWGGLWSKRQAGQVRSAVLAEEDAEKWGVGRQVTNHATLRCGCRAVYKTLSNGSRRTTNHPYGFKHITMDSGHDLDFERKFSHPQWRYPMDWATYWTLRDPQLVKFDVGRSNYWCYQRAFALYDKRGIKIASTTVKVIMGETARRIITITIGKCSNAGTRVYF